jgi:hypothetical protein
VAGAVEGTGGTEGTEGAEGREETESRRKAPPTFSELAKETRRKWLPKTWGIL